MVQKAKLVTNVHSEVAQDMIRFAELRREELTAADFAAMSRWRSFAAVNMFSWGVATSAIAYIGARLAAPRGPLPTASKVITAAAFVVGGASALPATAPQLIHDAQALPTPFGQYVRESFQKHSAAVGLAGPREPKLGQALAGETDRPLSASQPVAVNQWGDPVVSDSSSSLAADSGSNATFSDALSSGIPLDDEARDPSRG